MSSVEGVSTPNDPLHTRSALDPLAVTDATNQHEPLDDVYRGLYEAPDLQRSPSVQDYFSSLHPSVAPSVSSGSSSSSETTTRGRRLGALSALVERAVSHWARGTYPRSTTYSSASSGSSSTTSSSSADTRSQSRSRTHTRRKPRVRRRSSTATLNNNHDLSPVRLARARQLLEHSRRLPREFTLLLPPSVHPPTTSQGEYGATIHQDGSTRIMRKSSVKDILGPLEGAMKRPHRHKDRASKDHVPSVSYLSRPSMPGRGLGKGKGKAHATAPGAVPMGASRPSVTPFHHRSTDNADASERPAWWLDVASPTWDDMRALGKLLHLHPLTLEDILQQEPREKLELFPRLGYYFIVFRAVEAQYTADRDLGVGKAAECVIAVNLYLIVFKEGICSFHFEDISEHANRLRNRIVQLGTAFRSTSEWIAHGLMDSIVDGFAPIIHGIEVEVDEIESLVSGLNEDEVQALQAERGARLMITNDRPAETTDPEKRSGIADAVVDLASPDPEKARHLSPIKETANVTSRGRKSRFLDLTDLSLPPRLRSFIARIRWDRLVECQNPDSILVRLLRLKPNPGAESSTTVDVLASKDRRTTGYKVLLRMAASRRLVTSLMRVLAPKNEVIVQIRKRLQTPGGLIWPHQTSNGKDGSGSGLGIRSGSTSGVELDIYLGDVQDHIVSMQQALVHYERILSQAHPEYLSQLRYSHSNARGSIDKAVLVLTSVSMAILAAQVVIGLMSLNIPIPHNMLPPETGVPGPTIGKFYAFGIVLSIVTCVVSGVAVLIRWWMRKAKKKFQRSRDI